MQENILLSVKHLSIGFPGNSGKILPVVRDVSFAVERGKILALVGESGCGKSASCLSLGRLLPEKIASVSAAEMKFRCKNGEVVDLLDLNAGKLRKIRGGEIAYIFQEPAAALNPVFRIGDQIAEVIRLHRPDVADEKAEVIRLLEDVGIPAPEERIKAFPHELSGGMQQRVMIAMALAGEPSLLIADEPTTALDVTIQAQILELIDSLRKKRNMSVILVTHNLGIVSGMADRVAVMYAGDVVEYSPCRDLIEKPFHPYTEALLRAVPHLGKRQGKLEAIPGTIPAAEDFPAGCRFFGRCCKCNDSIADRCREFPPPDHYFDGGRSCRCHLFDDQEEATK